MARGLGVEIEGITVLHEEFAAPHDAEARPHLVTELPLDMVEQLGQIAIAAQCGSKNFGEHFLVGGAVDQAAAVAVGDAQHFRAVIVVAARALP